MIRKRLATILASVALLVPATATAWAAGPPPPPGQAHPAGSTLMLSLSSGQKPLPTREWALLRCQPPGGSHPRAAVACESLAAANGDVADVDLRSGEICIQIYAPVTVTATGMWRGDRVRYRETFGNSCMLNAMKGPVFQF